MIGFLTSKIGGYLAAIAAALAFLTTLVVPQRKVGRKSAENETMRNAARKQEEGRDAVQDLRDADRGELAGKLQDNDAKW